jgi:cyanophycin synthetase
VTDLVHPSIVEHAILATRVVGLDISGIDLVVEDISRPLEEQKGMFVEVNAGPGLLMHLEPTIGQPRPVGEAIVNHLFPPGETGRIPIVAVTGTNGKTTTCRIIARILKEAGRRVGMATSDGVTVDGRTIDIGDCAGPRSARNVLINPVVEAAVFECARGGILREGLGFDKCDVAVVTNIAGADHLGQWDIQTPEEMFKVKRTPVDVVLPSGAAVLNAADPLVIKMAGLSAGRVILFGRDAQMPAILEHRAAGKGAVCVENGWIVLGEGASTTPLLPLSDVPCTHGGRIGFQIENVLAATAAAWGLGLATAHIQAGLRGFQGNVLDDPARFSVFEVAGRTLIAVDCRNASALSALIDALQEFPQKVRAVVYSGEQDRRDQDLKDQGRLLGMAFDRIVLCEIEEESVRKLGEVTSLLKEGVEEAKSRARVEAVVDWSAAVDLAWGQLGFGELLVIQTSTIPKTVRKIESLIGVEFADVPRLASA